MRQELRFCTTPDGVRLAYARTGHGAPLVKAGNWMTHLERDWTSPVWRHWLTALGAEQTVIRYDERGSGLSDRRYPSLALDDWVSDLETVVGSAGVDRFTLLGISQGGPIAIAYAARHPERVARLVLYGTFACGRRHRRTGPEAEEEAAALIALTRAGWGRRNPAFRRLFTMLFIPGGSEAQMNWFDDLQQSRKMAAIEDEHRAQLARHDEHGIAEAVTDAFATGHDDEESVWFVAAQLLEDGHNPCRCAAGDNCERESPDAS